MTEPIGPFLGLDAGDAVELGELLAFLSDWLASDPNRIDASLHDFVGYRITSAQPARSKNCALDVDRFARTLLGYDWATGEGPRPPRDVNLRSPA